ncbi:MAG: DNA polymerase III subunit gamma/tau [Tenacibaculum sp.]
MEHFVVSARKYRPQTFKEVVGQQAITHTLENAIKNNHLAQALLFTGPRGVGKTSCARILAKQINQDLEIGSSKDFAFNIFELDAASNNSVDDIRNLIDQVRIPPQIGKYKVYIIDEVHMLSQAAFNAFLKTLEEPPAHAIFILATTEKHKIIPTILSRCQIFDFKRISVSDAKDFLKHICDKEGITAEDDALYIIAQKADGAMRDALSIFDRVISFSGNNLTRQAVAQNLNVLDYQVYFQITDLLLQNKIPNILISFDKILAKGFEGQHFINGLAMHFRDLLVAKDSSTLALLEVGANTKKNYLKQAVQASVPFLLQAIDKANSCDLNYKTSKNQRLLVELTLMQIASITFDKQKKKSDDYIIPSHLIKNSLSSKSKNSSSEQIAELKNNTTPINKDNSNTEYTKNQNTSVLENTRRGLSALSLKNVNSKEELPVKNIEENEKLAKTNFTEQQLKDAWKNYYLKLQEQGEHSMAAIITLDKPVLLKNFKIQIAAPNQLIKQQLEDGKSKFVAFLRKKLNNYKIQLDFILDKTIEKKHAYTSDEKYQKLKQKNPLLEKLKDTFGLEI